MAKIKQIVDAIMSEDINPHPFDFLFRYNTRNYPKTSHSELELPGKFEEIKDSAVFVMDNGALEMDYLESVKPDGKLVKRDALNNVGQETGRLSPTKPHDLFDYGLSATIQYKRPCYAIVATNYDYGVPYKDYTIEGFSFRIYFRIFNEQKVYKLLNTLIEKDYNKFELTNVDFILFVHCLIFAKKPYAQDVVEKLVHLFAKIENINLTHQLDLHLALKMMVKYHFKDDIDEKERLLTMITKAVHEEEHNQISGYEVKQISNEKLQSKIHLLTNENRKQKEELNEKNETITQQDKELNEKNETITQQDKEIKKLKSILLKNNILI